MPYLRLALCRIVTRMDKNDQPLNLEQILAVAKAAAARASQIAREQRASLSVQVSFKEARNLVTTADLACEAAIIETIRASFPNHTILAEESAGSVNPESCRTGPVWVIDPIDGTTNYAHEHYQVGVSVAFAMDSVVLVAAIEAPFLGEVFTAIKGRGAFLNGRAIRVREVSGAEEALVATGFPYRRVNLKNICGRVERVLSRCRDLRRIGAATLDISWVGCGRIDAFYEEGLMPWDVAASGLVAREAGAIVGHFPYDSDSQRLSSAYSGDLFADNILIASPGCYSEIEKLLVG
mgnify:CR=1 FL=1